MFSIYYVTVTCFACVLYVVTFGLVLTAYFYSFTGESAGKLSIKFIIFYIIMILQMPRKKKTSHSLNPPQEAHIGWVMDSREHRPRSASIRSDCS